MRRLIVVPGLAALLALAVAGLLRSAGPAARTDPVAATAAELRCPACQGESVVDSPSPIAASMRQVIADHLAQGRSREEIRRWFVARYGDEVLAQPPARGPGLLLWVVPAIALLGAGAAAARTLRPRLAGSARRSGARTRWPRHPGSARRSGGRTRWPRHPGGARRADGATSRWSPGPVCSLTAAGLIALVAAVAVAADGLAPPAPPPADPAAVALRLAWDLEGRQQYEAAAQMYREALRERTDDGVQLRLAFALLRSSDAAGAERAAREVLDHAPESPDGLLVLGLAQRATRPADATATLRRFLAVAPSHPAAAEIRRLLDP
ncbi:hypothetical protein GCM10011608_49200 [Micromonospora sonchi]|uniref:Cytochrome c-type biogenesis protein n=1 Tax=Micromonospora sonchi TaxID=1763543 RepID=A0A917U5B9_9ACTN|nr:cytochrome c-type biogenesis protein CcmH [Micromonospora sonchi]GGM58384.1 hypothetical protein GCM10011608_49200 [Micromonospora sonchi]